HRMPCQRLPQGHGGAERLHRAPAERCRHRRGASRIDPVDSIAQSARDARGRARLPQRLSAERGRARSRARTHGRGRAAHERGRAIVSVLPEGTMHRVEIRSGVWTAYEDDWFGPPWTTPQTVVLVHGNSESSRAWTQWVPQLADKYRVIRLDLPG